MTAPAIPLFPSLGAAVRAPVWRVAIDGKDITREITPMVVGVTYSDHAHGTNDDVAITLEDSDGKWRNAWYPTKGDRLEVWIGYEGGQLLPCGRFQIDEVTLEGPPDTATVRGIAAGVIPSFRTKRSKAYEAQSLKAIAEAVAARHSLTIVGSIEDIRVERMTQRDETDLNFLTRIAELYGYVFTIRGAQLVFFQVQALYDRDVSTTIRRTDVTRYHLVDTSVQTFKAATVAHTDAKSGTLQSGTASAAGISSGDTLKVTERAENREQANAIASAALVAANSSEKTGTVTLEGDPRLVAGATARLIGWGKLDGKYFVDTSTHRATRSDGYVTELEVKRVAA